MDIQNENNNCNLLEIKNQTQLLMQQNATIKLMLHKEENKSIDLKKQLFVMRPFIQTKTGEILFPGKKEMKHKLDIMNREILRLKSLLDGFKKDRCQVGKTREMIKSICNIEPNNGNEDKPNELLENQLNELREKYKVLDNQFDQVVLDISKHRVRLEKEKKKLHLSEKHLKEMQFDFNEVSSQVASLEMNTETNEDKAKMKAELDSAKSRLDDLKSLMVFQMDEIDDKNKSYMNALHVKEYQTIRANNLCKEKAMLTAKFESELNQIKEYFKKRVDHTSYLPTALLAAQEQLVFQKKIKTSMEETIEILKNKLRTLMGDEDVGGDSAGKLKALKKLKAKNIELRSELEKKEKVSADIKHMYDETKQNANNQKSRLKEIQIETALKINKSRILLNGLTEEYLNMIDKLQNEVSKIEAASCFEDDKLTLVTSKMQKQIDSLSNIFQNIQEQVNEIKNLHNCHKNTEADICKPRTVSKANLL